MSDDSKVSRCADCGCELADHHKLHCESDQCPGCSGGWLCPRHNLVLCGCTYQGGPESAELTLVEFLRARYDEDAHAIERLGSEPELDSTLPTSVDSLRRLRTDVEAKRRIVEWHENWPMLVDQPPVMSSSDHGTFAQISQHIAWMTTQEYRARFGDDPPTGPVLRLLALPYDHHPDYREDWRP